MSPVTPIQPDPPPDTPDEEVAPEGGHTAGSFSTFLHAQTPTRLRGLMWLAMPELATILSSAVASDAGGGGTTVWSVAGTTHCRIDPAGGAGMRVTAGRLDETATHLISTPVTALVQETDRFIISTRGTFEVLAVHQRTNERAKRFEVIQTS